MRPAPAERLPPTTAAPPEDPSFRAPGDGPQCIAAACTLDFDLKEPPSGTSPELALKMRPDPFRLEVRSEGLGEPDAWVRAGGTAAREGAVAFGVFASDDALNGALLCVLDGDGDCVTEDLPSEATSRYNRISVLAIADTVALPSPAEGFDRLVTTVALDVAVELR